MSCLSLEAYEKKFAKVVSPCLSEIIRQFGSISSLYTSFRGQDLLMRTMMALCGVALFSRRIIE